MTATPFPQKPPDNVALRERKQRPTVRVVRTGGGHAGSRPPLPNRSPVIARSIPEDDLRPPPEAAVRAGPCPAERARVVRGTRGGFARSVPSSCRLQDP